MEETAHPTVPSRTLAPADAPRLRIGGEFRGLQVHSLLGEGAMGAAYLASHPILQMPLVVKVFRSEEEENIFREAHLAARVASPNVVSVLDAGYEAGVAFIIQRYIDGIDLAELVTHLQHAEWRLPANMICRMMIDAAKGLHAIHQAGVIHRDVKPANLFLCGSGIATIGDFGVALDLLQEDHTQLGAGTPRFMAPEQWERKKLSRHTDIYALGATAHLLATKKFPFEDESLDDLRVAHVHRAYRPPIADGPSEAYLFSVIERALRKRPEERFSNAGELARVLKVVAEPLPQIVCAGADEARIGGLRLELLVGDLAEQAGDCIVNAANQQLTMNLGVASALRRVGGQAIEDEAMAHAPAAMGDVVWTGAGRLRARWVAHAVAAVEGAVCLQRACLRVLLQAEVRRAQSVLFPALGTGVGDVPMDLAAKLILEATRTFAALQPTHVRHVRVVLYDERSLSRWRTVMHSM
ncbi:MAG TPA: serine/threonine-protein kinase [Pyrinomonadaceae bacterium]